MYNLKLAARTTETSAKQPASSRHQRGGTILKNIRGQFFRNAEPWAHSPLVYDVQSIVQIAVT